MLERKKKGRVMKEYNSPKGKYYMSLQKSRAM